MKKELAIGAALGTIIFLAIRGYDIVPLIFIILFAAGVYFLAESRGLTKVLNNAGNGTMVTGITFGDVGGQSSAIQELKEALDFTKYHKTIARLGIRPLKGILLTGPPGTGKTLMAKAAASYTDAVFVAASGSEFIEMYAGVGAQRVRKLFKSAREMAAKQNKKNAIIFIDEIDVLGGTRGRHQGHMEYDQTLNQLLVEMDGIKTDDDIKVLLVAATNRADMLDPALLRPGRFDRQVKVDLPDKDGRLQILNLHIRNKPLDINVSLEEIARETFGFSGAQLESLANEAAIFALRESKDKVEHAHFKEAIDKVILGEKLDRRPTRDELQRVAVHEVGHAIISEMLRPGSVSTLTITPRGNALGYMRQTPEDDTYLDTRETLENEIAIALGGAVAEDIVLGLRSTGAAGDFDQAVKVARKIVAAGMSSMGVVAIDSVPAGKLHREISEMLKEQEERVHGIIARSLECLSVTVGILMDEESINGEKFRAILEQEKEIAVS